MAASFGVFHPWILVGVLLPFRLCTTPEMVALAHDAESLDLSFWTLWCLVSRGNGTLGDDNQRFSFVGGGFGSYGRVVPRFGLWRNIPRRHGIMASGSPSGSYLEGRVFSFEGNVLARRHWLLASGPNFSCMVDDAYVKFVDTGALGRRATRTANVKIRPMGPMVSLALPPSSRPMERRAVLFSRIH